MATRKLELECHSGAGLGLLSSIHGRGAVRNSCASRPSDYTNPEQDTPSEMRPKDRKRKNGPRRSWGPFLLTGEQRSLISGCRWNPW
jgi:hypothetical protein